MKKVLIITSAVMALFIAALFLVPVLFPGQEYPLAEMTEKYAPGKTITVDGKQVHFMDKGRGPVLILLHGLVFHTIMWERNMEALSKKYRVIALDLWGWGFSERLDADTYSFNVYARQVTGFMDALGIKRASLAGQSMGGGVAVYTAARYPQRIEKLILVAPAVIPYDIPLDAKMFILPVIGEFMNAIATDSMVKDTVRKVWFFDSSKAPDVYADRVIRPLKVQGTLDGMVFMQRSMLAPPIVTAEAEMLSKNLPPILIVHGREDRAVPLSCSQRLNLMWKGSQLEIFEKAGHSPNQEYPEQFNRLVMEFL
ncbi:MAG: hypothetical protein CVV44_06695 [Spirochaetae bacterium HGW-Spirochaetae-1]|jgi:pimeloyl-ACP methyl ester carboxylesterase|nr:MAG: hypothetical protein CVV44_06695 [Spirochaetae bacterium HGW-Spirochaetae-1]